MPVFYSLTGFNAIPIGDRLLMPDGSDWLFNFNGKVSIADLVAGVVQQVAGDGVTWADVDGFPDSTISVGALLTRIHNGSGGPWVLNYAGWDWA